MTINLQQQIADLTAKHEAELANRIATLVREESLRALCPEGETPEGFLRVKHDDTDTIRFDVENSVELRALLDAWHSKYGPFLPVGEYRKGCVTVTAYPWAEYATVEPSNECPDGIVVRNHVGRGFNSLSFDFYPNIPGHRVRVQVSEKFRAHIGGFHGYVSANYNQLGDPVYNSIKKVAPSAYKAAAFTLLYGSGSDDAADFSGTFSFDQLLGVLS